MRQTLTEVINAYGTGRLLPLLIEGRCPATEKSGECLGVPVLETSAEYFSQKIMALGSTAMWMSRQAVRLRGRSFGTISTTHTRLLNLGVCCQQRIVIRETQSPSQTFSTSRTRSQSEHTPSDAKSTTSDQRFKNIYTFRYIVQLRVLSRFKIYQTLLTTGAVPLGMFLNNTGAISASGLSTFIGIASLATAMLYVMSTFFRRVVGIISVNENEERVRISHLTFWGKRKDMVMDVSEIVPLSDMSVKPNDIYQAIQFYNKPTMFYWFHRHGKNTDAAGIQRIFGKF